VSSGGVLAKEPLRALLVNAERVQLVLELLRAEDPGSFMIISMASPRCMLLAGLFDVSVRLSALDSSASQLPAFVCSAPV
jgi:hypothetical protein